MFEKTINALLVAFKYLFYAYIAGTAIWIASFIIPAIFEGVSSWFWGPLGRPIGGLVMSLAALFMLVMLIALNLAYIVVLSYLGFALALLVYNYVFINTSIIGLNENKILKTSLVIIGSLFSIYLITDFFDWPIFIMLYFDADWLGIPQRLLDFIIHGR